MEEDYNPYCTECSGCGEDPCCSALMCKQSPNGKYCKTYLKDLQVGYMVYDYFSENLLQYLPSEALIKYDKEVTRIMDEVYNKINE